MGYTPGQVGCLSHDPWGWSNRARYAGPPGGRRADDRRAVAAWVGRGCSDNLGLPELYNVVLICIEAIVTRFSIFFLIFIFPLSD